jgi:ligand-binding SRPBCC domain-containing protein
MVHACGKIVSKVIIGELHAMPVIEITTLIAAPIQRVFDLSRSIDLHTTSTAQTGEQAIAGVTSGLIGLGQEVTWRARHLGVRQHLTTRITAFDPPVHFRDTMVRGAFRRFDHDHFFSENEAVTDMRDVFDFESPLGVLGGLADRLFLTDYLKRLLVTRNMVIKLAAETDEWRRYLQET